MSRASVPLGVVAGIAIGACFIKPGAPDTREDAGDTREDGMLTPIDAPFDTSVDSGPPPGCTRYDFDAGSSNCGGFGSGVGEIDVANGMLMLSIPQSGSSATARCSRGPATYSSVTFNVTSVPSTFNAVTEVFAEIGGIRYGARLTRSTSHQITGFCGGASASLAVTWSAMHRFIRIRDAGPTVVIEIAEDANGWTFVHSCNSPGISNAVLGMEVMRPSSGSAGTVSIEYVDTCP